MATKVTLLSPRMSFLQVTRVHPAALHSRLVHTHWPWGASPGQGLCRQELCGLVTKDWQRGQGLSPVKIPGTKSCPDCDFKRLSCQTWIQLVADMKERPPQRGEESGRFTLNSGVVHDRRAQMRSPELWGP